VAVAMENVILVPPKKRKTFLVPEQAGGIRIQSEDADTWVQPTDNQKKLLLQFLDESEKSGEKFISFGPGTRVGHDNTGVYIHERHLKRYYGLARAGAGVALKAAVPEAVPEVQLGSVHHDQDDSTSRIMNKMLAEVPSITIQARKSVLQATFQSSDKDGNGVLNKSELVNLMRRVMPTMSGKQVIELMKDVDTNKNGEVDYPEFVLWLSRNGPDGNAPMDVMTTGLKTESDCVLAMFRAWDKNGDGIITKKELTNVLKQTCPKLNAAQLEALCLQIDANRDGQIDYQEFVDFIFGKQAAPVED